MIVEGFGTITKREDKETRRCRRWRLRVPAGLNTKTGRTRYRTQDFTGTYSDAVEALKAFNAQVQREGRHDKRNLTVGQLCDEWMEERKMVGEVAQETIEKNENHIKVIKHQLDGTPARALETHHITEALSNLMDGDSPSGKPLSGTYCQGVLATLKMVYSWANKRRYVSSNPTIDAPRPKNDTPEQKALTAKQTNSMTSKLSRSSRTDAAIMLALWGGLRRGEVTSITWGHVDLVGGVMSVPGTKNDASYAAIPMFPQLVEFLLEWKENQRAELAEMGLVQDDSTPVIANGAGDAYTPDGLGKAWRERRDSLGLPGFKLHELRHSFATMLARGGFPAKGIQAFMRHSDERTALRIYQHFNADDLRASMERFLRS